MTMSLAPALALIGRIALSLLFIIAGYHKAMAPDPTIAYFTQLGLPNPTAAYYVTLVFELGFGALLFVGLLTRLAGLGLAVWSIATAAVAHSNIADYAQQTQLLKNLSIAGGMLYVVAFGAGALAIDNLFRRGPARTVPAEDF